MNRQTTLTIGGMSCGGCVAGVTRALEGTEGVTRARVDLASGRAEVDYDDSRTSPEALVAAVEAAGFEACA